MSRKRYGLTFLVVKSGTDDILISGLTHEQAVNYVKKNGLSERCIRLQTFGSVDEF